MAIKQKEPFTIATPLGWVSLALVSLAIITATTYFGGMRMLVAKPLFLVGAALWGLMLAHLSVAWQRGTKMGDWLDLTVMLFLGYLLFSWIYSPTTFDARKEALWVLTYAAIFWNVRYGLRNRDYAAWIMGFIVLAAAIACVYGFVHKGQDVYSIWGTLRPDYGVRMSGTFGCPNHFANLLVMACACALILGVMPGIAGPVRVLCFYFVAFFTVGIFFSISRGGYIAWVVTMCVLVMTTQSSGSRYGWIWKTLILTVISALVLFAIVNSNSVIQRLQQNPMLDVRVALAKDALTIWQSAPLFGTGAASFRFVHPRIQDKDYSTLAEYTHNDYLNLLADYGLTGFLIVAGFFGILAAILLIRRRTQTFTDRHVLLNRLTLAVFAGMMAHSVVDFNFHIPACAMTFFAIMGLGTMRTQRDPSDILSLNLKPALTTISTLALLITLFYTYRTWSGACFLTRNEPILHTLDTDQVLRLAKKGLSIDPVNTAIPENFADALRVRLIENNQKQTDVTEKDLIERIQVGQTALTLYDLALKTNPIDDRIFIKKAVINDLLGRYPEAYILYDQALTQQPHNRYFHQLLGFHLWKRGAYQKALERFKIVKTYPLSHRTDRDKIMIERVDKAIVRLEKVVEKINAKNKNP